MTFPRYEATCLLATLVVLSAGAANKIRLGAPPDAGPFLKRVRDAATSVEREVPGMTVKRGQLPRQAFDLLHPNVLESRTYTDLLDGTMCSVLLVHCGDVSDMGAHYPPACYAGSGLTVTEVSPMPIQANELTLNGVEYALSPARLDGGSPIRIWNCMFLPDGVSTYQPAELRKHARTDSRRYYGAGQIQILIPASVPEQRRGFVYNEVMAIYEPVIRAMMSDPRKPQPLALPNETRDHE